MRLFGRNGLFYTGNLALQRRDIGFELDHAEPVQHGRDQQFLRRAGEIFLRKCHKTILTDGWRGFHTPRKVTCEPQAHSFPFQAHRLVTSEGI